MQNEPKLADLRSWGETVGESLDQVTVVHDYYCELCDRPLMSLDKPLEFTNLHTLVREVLIHMRETHPGTIPVRPGRT